jgi:cell division protein YceG involved in septum cleavage
LLGGNEDSTKPPPKAKKRKTEEIVKLSDDSAYDGSILPDTFKVKKKNDADVL